MVTSVRRVGSLAAAAAFAAVASIISFPASCHALLVVVPAAGPAVRISSSVSSCRRPSPFGVSVHNNSNGVCRSTRSVRRREPLSARSTSSSRPDIVAVAAAAGPAVLDRPSTTVEKKASREDKVVRDRRNVGNESWEVRIYNDRTNTREHVARCLVRVIGLSETTAYNTMMQAHQHGIAVVGTWVFERAEMYYEALKQSGIICYLNPVDGTQ